MGADKSVLVNDPTAEGSDALATARILTAAMKGIPYDLIISGQRGVDDDNYQVGAAVAEYLGIPQISLVVKEEISDGKIRCACSIEGGTVSVEAALPALSDYTTDAYTNVLADIIKSREPEVIILGGFFSG